MSNSIPILTVSELTSEIHYQLASQFSSLFVCGEVSGLYRPQSGHWYFTLKDAQSQIKAVIWKSDAERIFRNQRFEFQNGISIICGGSLSVFSSRGEYQINVRSVQTYGEGPRELALRQLKERLEKEGLFDIARKRTTPLFPKSVAVITSPTGAAIRDFLHVLRPRWSQLTVTILPVKVQGDGASAQIEYALKSISRFENPPDVVVLTRGGGSIEDLWSFNEEAVCRAIYHCPVPVVCGVGHEVDVTLADFVADIRALTPSDAALRIVPDQVDVRRQLNQLKRQMAARLESVFQQAQQLLDSFAQRPVLSAPLVPIRNKAMDLDRLQGYLQRALANRMRVHEQLLQSVAGRLASVNPASVLARGYSITSNSNGDLITGSQQVRVGERLTTRLANGSLTSRLEEIS
jgi:exodeoxyribonuclease VII large subunit